MRTSEEIHQEYYNLVHAVQTGNLQLGDQVDPKIKAFKHVRTGIDVSLAGIDALKNLLVQKGIITEEEFLEACIVELKHKVKMMEERISKHYSGGNSNGPKIRLG